MRRKCVREWKQGAWLAPRSSLDCLNSLRILGGAEGPGHIREHAYVKGACSWDRGRRHCRCWTREEVTTPSLSLPHPRAEVQDDSFCI